MVQSGDFLKDIRIQAKNTLQRGELGQHNSQSQKFKENGKIKYCRLPLKYSSFVAITLTDVTKICWCGYVKTGRSTVAVRSQIRKGGPESAGKEGLGFTAVIPVLEVHPKKKPFTAAHTQRSREPPSPHRQQPRWHRSRRNTGNIFTVPKETQDKMGQPEPAPLSDRTLKGSLQNNLQTWRRFRF